MYVSFVREPSWRTCCLSIVSSFGRWERTKVTGPRGLPVVRSIIFSSQFFCRGLLHFSLSVEFLTDLFKFPFETEDLTEEEAARRARSF